MEKKSYYFEPTMFSIMEDELDNNETLKKAQSYVKEAEKILLKYWPRNMENKEILSVIYKDDESPTSKADIEAQQIIIQRIQKDFPEHGIIGEEGCETLDSNTDYTWIIDPLDGTKNYIRGHKIFSTQLALAYKGEIILGISNAPLLNENIWAIRGKGAYLNSNRLHVSTVQTLQESFISFANIKFFINTETIKPLNQIIMESSWSRGYGDFISYHMVARGDLDAMIEVDTCIWDIAALSLIVKESGGRVTDLYGNNITFESDTCIASNGLFHDLIVDYFKDSNNKK